MRAKTTRYIDKQGRIILPAHIRNALNLTSGRVVEIAMEEDGTVRIIPTQERCAFCGEGLEDVPHITITVGPSTKHICSNCEKQIKEAANHAEI